jgi:hypothetical protein
MKYRHKPSGRIYEKMPATGDYYTSMPASGVPPEIVESGNDWELVEEPKPVPPGIISFINPKGSCVGKLEDEGALDYKSWVKIYYGSWKVHSILVGRVIWTVGEKVLHFHKYEIVIKELRFTVDEWFAIDENDHSFAVIHLSKLPKRTPIVTLAGVPIYEGDKFWYVTTYWGIDECSMEPKQFKHMLKDRSFSTKEIAEEFVRDNKPVVPYGELEKAFHSNSLFFKLRDILEKYKP